MQSQEKRLSILMMPDYRQDNPYQMLLAQALEQPKITISFPVGYKRIFPLYRQIKNQSTPVHILHLHWLSPYLKGENALVKLIYGLKFLLDVYIVKKNKIKIIWTIHNLTDHNAKFPEIEKVIKQFFLYFVDHAIVHSEAAKTMVLETYRFNPEKVAVIPHGHYRDVYPEAIAQREARQQLNLPLNFKIFLNFGMIKPYKGIESLLEIWGKYTDISEEAYLLVVGRALDEAYGQKITQQIATIKNGKFINEFIPDDQLHLYFSAADVIVLPFNRILTSGSLLLAISYGKPVIAPKCDNLSETLEDAGEFLYDNASQDGLLEKIHASINANLDNLAEKTYRVGDRLSWSNIAVQTIKTYQASQS